MKRALLSLLVVVTLVAMATTASANNRRYRVKIRTRQTQYVILICDGPTGSTATAINGAGRPICGPTALLPGPLPGSASFTCMGFPLTIRTAVDGSLTWTYRGSNGRLCPF